MKHHVSAGVGPSGPGDVVLPDEETRDCGVWSTTSVPVSAHPDLGTWCFRTKKQGIAGSEAPRQCRQRLIRTCGRGASPDPNPLFSRNERSRCTKCTAASSIYYAFFGAASSKAKPAPPGSVPQARQRLASPATPSPHRRSLLIGEACASRAYIGCLGMRTVKVVPSPGMLST